MTAFAQSQVVHGSFLAVNLELCRFLGSQGHLDLLVVNLPFRSDESQNCMKKGVRRGTDSVDRYLVHVMDKFVRKVQILLPRVGVAELPERRPEFRAGLTSPELSRASRKLPRVELLPRVAYRGPCWHIPGSQCESKNYPGSIGRVAGHSCITPLTRRT